MTFPVGSTVRRKDGTAFSNGEMVVTVSDKTTKSWVWLVETDTKIGPQELEAAILPTEVDKMPSVQMLRAERMKMALEAILELYGEEDIVYKYAKAGLTGKTAAETDY